MHLFKDPRNRIIDARAHPLFDIRLGAHGKSLFWKGLSLPKGKTVLKFTGSIVDGPMVPDSMQRFVVRVDLERYLVPDGIAMFANHSCEPNCRINDDFWIETVRPIDPEEEITISYDCVSPADYKIFGFSWDPRWSFKCGCGSKNCVGQIDGYRLIPGSSCF